jgi:hypothetical protein
MTKEERARVSRENGAKSKGPKNLKPMYRNQSAQYQHGLYAARGHMLPGESIEEYMEIQVQLRAYWQPKNYYDEQLVEELAGNLWESKRVQAALNDYLHDELAGIAKNSPHCRDQAKLNLEAEKKVTIQGGSIRYYHLRRAHYAREQHRIERRLLQLEKRAPNPGPTQMSLIINNRQNPDIPASADAKPVDGRLSENPYVVEATEEPLPESFNETEPETNEEPKPEEPKEQDIVNWAKENLDFQPDEFQTQILTEANSRIMVLGPRQTGKSTAAAVRVIFEATKQDDTLILLASASGRQSGQIMEKARKMAQQLDLHIGPPPPKCDGFSLNNGSQIVSLPDNEQTIRGFSAPKLIIIDEAAFASAEALKALEPMLSVSAGTIMLLSTPNGQHGYFYEQWHAEHSNWTKLKGTLEGCPRMKPEAIEAIRKSMSKDDFEQEFECRFIAASGQIISLETIRACYTEDFDLFDPEYDLGVNKGGE